MEVAVRRGQIKNAEKPPSENREGQREIGIFVNAYVQGCPVSGNEEPGKITRCSGRSWKIES